MRRGSSPTPAKYPIPLLPKFVVEDDGDQPRPPSPGGGGGAGLRKNKKAATAGVRAWLLLDSTGQTQVVKAGKQAIMRRTGLPARDLRLLDPFLSYPSAVLGRERALVINLEHIKAIITAHEVFLLNSKDPSVTPFVEQLQTRILARHNATKSQKGGVNTNDADWRNFYGVEEPRSSDVTPQNLSKGFPLKDDEDREEGKGAFANRDVLKLLPFEFVALEACLESVCSSMDNEARTLELEAYPALDKLTSKISTRNLERVRQIKSRLVSITGRVQKVRDELEHLLDDEQDMSEMYLTEKLLQQNFDSSIRDPDDINDDALRSDMDQGIPAEISLERDGDSIGYEGDRQHSEIAQAQFPGTTDALNRDSQEIHKNAMHSNTIKVLDVEELEMLLEAYFIQIDRTLNNLSTLREYVDDTEDYINILLDDKQNHLLQMGVMLTTATLMLTVSVIVTGIFGMNIHIPLFLPESNSMQEWLLAACSCGSGSILLYVIAVVWYKHRRLL